MNKLNIKKVPRKYLYAVLAVIVVTTVCFGLFKIYEDKKIKADLEEYLTERAEGHSEPVIREVIIGDPVAVAREQIKQGNMTPIGQKNGCWGFVYPVGIDCPEDLPLILDGVSGIIIGGSPDALARPILWAKYSAYNRELISSPDYTGPCKPGQSPRGFK